MAEEFVRERVRIRILARNSVKAVELEQVTTVEIVDSFEWLSTASIASS